MYSFTACGTSLLDLMGTPYKNPLSVTNSWQQVCCLDNFPAFFVAKIVSMKKHSWIHSIGNTVPPNHGKQWQMSSITIAQSHFNNFFHQALCCKREDINQLCIDTTPPPLEYRLTSMRHHSCSLVSLQLPMHLQLLVPPATSYWHTTCYWWSTHHRRPTREARADESQWINWWSWSHPQLMTPLVLDWCQSCCPEPSKLRFV